MPSHLPDSATYQPDFAVTVAVLLLPVRVWEIDARWLTGPLPLRTGPLLDEPTTAETRRTYFERRTADALYGAGDNSRRWHDPQPPSNPPAGGVEVLAQELWHVREFDETDGANGLLVLHVGLDRADPVRSLDRLVRLKGWGTHLRDWVDDQHCGLTLTSDAGRAFSITYAAPATHELPASELEAAFDGSRRDAWLWSLASATPAMDKIPDADATDHTYGEAIPLSRDWRATVLRDGAAFLALRGTKPDQEAETDFLRSAVVFVRSIYTDVFLLAVAQQLILRDLADRIADLSAPGERLDELLVLERQFSKFRNVYWWQHLTEHGVGNHLLRAFHRQHALPELFNQIVAELNDYERQANLRSQLRATAQSRATNILLSALAVIGLPLTAAQTTATVTGSSQAGLAAAAVSLVALCVVGAPLRLRRRHSRGGQ